MSLKSYDPKEAEQRWQQAWHNTGVYAWNEAEPRENNYVIDTPPPTVSGVLHMGHIFSYTQADFIARYMRMKGMNVFYPMGFDDNGLPTERLVEKVRSIRATNMPREEFIKICLDVVREAEEEFRRLFKSVALSVDWNQEYQTISEHTRRISQMSFLDLFRKGEVYRKFEPVLWDPIDQTALAQADVKDEEMPSVFYDITFFVDGLKRSNGAREEVVIATTRPELLPACVAVMYHPDDTRYVHLKGHEAIVPVFGVKVPFIADDKVLMEKGTGLVMCCTFGDQTDVEWWKRHNLPLRIILDKSGRMNGEALKNLAENHSAYERAKRATFQFAEKLNGMKVKDAREAVIATLRVYEIIRDSKEITHAVKCAERSGAPLEILVTPQWFVKILDKKEQLLEKVRQVKWHPDFMRLRAEQWISGLSWDWCISRQRYFGIPFPVWFITESGSQDTKIVVADIEQLPVNPLVDLPKGYSLKQKNADNTFTATQEATGKEVIIIPDVDVMDTWATSSISPQISSHGIGESAINAGRHSKLFPADLRPQAHEIIRTWAFYTITKAHLHENVIPWKNAMISGWCLDKHKRKMSKSIGNVVTPVDLIQEQGADAVRYWASTSRLGMDTAFSEDMLKIGKKLVNKIWNATNFASQHFARIDTNALSTPANDIKQGKITEVLDLWIISRLARTLEKASAEFEGYEYCDARVAVEDFFWKDFCDNYLELCKTRAYCQGGFSEAQSESAIRTLYYCLQTILKLFSPFIPHVTEEVWQAIFAGKDKLSIHARGSWPEQKDYAIDLNAEAAGIAAVAVLEVVRKAKSERKVSIKYPLDSVIIYTNKSGERPELLNKAFDDLKATTTSDEVVLASTKPECSVDTEDGVLSVFCAFKAEGVAA